MKNKINIVKGLLASTLMLGVQFTGLRAFAFNDTNNHWANQDIQNLSSENIINGYTDGSFRPENSITRGEFAVSLAKMLNLPVTLSSDAPIFKDVKTGKWASASIRAVTEAQLMKGYPGDLFMPNRYITRSEVMSILSNSGHLAVPATVNSEEVLSTYSDSEKVPEWARKSVAKAVYTHISANSPSRENMLEPNRKATRGETSVMMVNLRKAVQVSVAKENLVKAQEKQQ
ncbi:MAG: S-layer homology domain-containing protein [Cyanobacteria bacterium]|nr:S-layer homology domain-containing protein [Cyanobacteriota bacterium]